MGLSIGLDVTAAVRQTAGIGRYTRELVAALERNQNAHTFKAFYCARGDLPGALPPTDARFHIRRLPASDRMMNVLWFRLHLPLRVQTIVGKVDLFHSPDFTLPPAGDAPTVLTIHDLAFLTVPDCAYSTLRAYLERAVPLSARRATRIIAVSEHTRRDVIRLLGISPEQVSTVHEAASSRFAPGNREEARQHLLSYGLAEPFLLAVGTLEPRKNYVRLLEAYSGLRRRGLRYPLVLAGRTGWLYQPILRRLRDLRLESYVRLIQPDESVLLSLYRAAEAFVYPSVYEGFGIPPLEALACGTPVACSQSSSLPEVVGDSALLFNPLDEEDMVETLWRLLSDDDLKQQLRRQGPLRAACFSWDRAATETIRVYESTAACG